MHALAPAVDQIKPAFVIGADQLLKLPTWHRFPELLGLAQWIVLARKPDGETRAREALRALAGVGGDDQGFSRFRSEVL